MADYCYLCNAKIGTFESHGEVVVDGVEQPLCQVCTQNIERVNEKNCSNAVSKTMYEKSLAYLIDFLVNDKELNSRKRQVIESLTGTTTASEKAKIEEQHRKLETESEEKKKLVNERSSILLTTCDSFEGYSIDSYKGVITGDSVLGPITGSNGNASSSNLADKEFSLMTEAAVAAKNHALDRLIDSALQVEANAILGVSFTLYSLDGNLLGASVTGTAVSVRKN